MIPGPLASPRRPDEVSVRSLAGLGSGFLPTVRHLPAVAFASYFVNRSYPFGILASLDSQFRTRDLHPISSRPYWAYQCMSAEMLRIRRFGVLKWSGLLKSLVVHGRSLRLRRRPTCHPLDVPQPSFMTLRLNHIMINRAALGIGAFVVVLVLILYILPLESARNAAAMARCSNNLQHLYIGILEYVKRNGDLPRNADGELWLVPLFEGPNALVDKANFSPCRGDDVTANYLCGHQIMRTDLQAHRDQPPRVLLCDQPGNHIYTRYGMVFDRPIRKDGQVQELAKLLLADGSVHFWMGDAADYEAWTTAFAKGVGQPYPPGLEERLR